MYIFSVMSSFLSQRMDLGECLKVHDLALRADYEIASKEQDFFFELDVCDFCFHVTLQEKYFEHELMSLRKKDLGRYLCDSMMINMWMR